MPLGERLAFEYNILMALLIDGYNLLHVTEIFGEGRGPGGFQRAREALLRFIAASVDDAERQHTTIVFDSKDTPPGLPKEVDWDGMLVLYAADYPDADTLIEELIEEHDAPRRLLVVSSDHRIQRAARRRKAKSIDSDRWYSDIWRQRLEARNRRGQPVPEKPIGDLSKKEVDYWVQQFATTELPTEQLSPKKKRNSKPVDQTESIDNPFPPGYGEDLLSE